MKKIIMYEALDGERFDTENECRLHEDELATVKMFDRKGLTTDKVEEAFIIYLGDSKHPGGSRFMAMGDEQKSTYNGIDCDEDYGWFYWDEWNDEYHYVDLKLLDVLVELYPIINQYR